MTTFSNGLQEQLDVWVAAAKDLNSDFEKIDEQLIFAFACEAVLLGYRIELIKGDAENPILDIDPEVRRRFDIFVGFMYFAEKLLHNPPDRLFRTGDETMGVPKITKSKVHDEWYGDGSSLRIIAYSVCDPSFASKRVISRGEYAEFTIKLLREAGIKPRGKRGGKKIWMVTPYFRKFGLVTEQDPVLDAMLMAARLEMRGRR